METNRDENVPDSSPSSTSELSSLSSDSDECNTSLSRVHFGPLRSPEKKFISRRQTLHPTALNLPRQRSTKTTTTPVVSPARASAKDSTMNQSESEEEEEEEDRTCLRTGTPDADRFSPDEPSSALASRIIRAQDNPSPPPSTGEQPDSSAFALDTSSTTVDAFQLSSSSPFVSTDAGIGESLSISCLMPTDPSLSEQELTLQTPLDRNVFNLAPLATVPENSTSPNDLISFDSFSAPSAADIPQVDAYPITQLSGSSGQILEENARSESVDDLLCNSPAPPFVPSPRFATPPPLRISPSKILVPITPSDGYMTKEMEISPDDSEERAVADDLMPVDVNDASKLPPLPRPDFSIGEQHTPLRRSTRPRRSVVPFTGNSVENQLKTPDRPPRSPSPRKLSRLVAAPSDFRHLKVKPDDTAINSGMAKLVLNSPGRSDRVVEGKDKGSADVAEKATVVQEEESAKKKGKRRDDGQSQASWSSQPEIDSRKELGILSTPSTIPFTEFVPVNLFPRCDIDSSPQKTTWPSRYSPRKVDVPSPVFFPPSQSPREAPSDARLSSPGTPDNDTSLPPYVAQRSPPKSRSATLDDPNRTPARRIPIEQAVAQGHISPQKASQFLRINHGLGLGSGMGSTLLRTSVLNRRLETDSPAMRVPMTPEREQELRSRSPVRVAFSGRGPSARLPPLLPGPGGGKLATVEVPSDPKTQRKGSPTKLQQPSRVPVGSKLPFPLVPTRDPAKSASESSGSSSMAGRTATTPPKSDLRQRSTVSRIPRIGTKPYARPATVAASRARKPDQGKVSTSMRRVDLVPSTETVKAPPKPFRMVDLRNGSGSSSDDSRGRNDTTSLTGDVVPRTTAIPETKPMDGSITNLKRKRGEKVSPSEKIIVFRQVTSGPPPSHPPYRAPDPKKTQPLTIRKVVDRSLGDRRQDACQPPPEAQDLDNPELPTTCGAAGSSAPVGDSLATNDTPSSSPDPLIPTSTGSTAAESTPLKDPDLILDNKRPSKARRTRSPRIAQSSTGSDVFGRVDRPPRRRANPHPSLRDYDIFSGMSAVELKTLTSANTAKNQKYLAAKLETEVIRKEGIRPDSPTVKMKTILQRQEEERERQRQERAERRARRSDEFWPLVLDDENSPRVEVMNALCNGTGQDDGGAVKRQKHRRGPGDEEDYVTPDKPERTKRGEDEIGGEKRVKWDRGLFSTIYLEDVHPRTRARPHDGIKKGCLAKTGKNLHLDVLGNLPNADAPLQDLVHENITVKKFIYDNDVDDTDKMATAKNPRPKGKKGKT